VDVFGDTVYIIIRRFCVRSVSESNWFEGVTV